MTFVPRVDFTKWLNDVPLGEDLTWEERGLKPGTPEDVVKEYERLLEMKEHRRLQRSGVK